MVSVQALLNDVQRAIQHASAATDRTAGALRDPAALAALILTGEQVREATQARLGVPIPRFCILSVTWACNLNCAGCYAKRYARGREMGLADIERVLGEARALGMYMYVIVGGEPLLVPGLIDVLARQRDSLFFLFTNGTLLTAAHAAALATTRTIVPILSIEGAEASTDSRRGAGVSAKLQTAMAHLRDHAVPFGCATMATHRNVAAVVSRAWFDTLWQFGARFCFVIDYVPTLSDTDESLRLTPADRAAKDAALAARYAEARPLVMNFPPDEYTSGGCQAAGRGFIHINADGFVEPCPFSHYASLNVRSTPLTEILGSSFFQAIRAHVDAVDGHPGECRLAATETRVREIAARCGAFSTETKRP